MFRTLLTPLVSRFDLSPLAPPTPTTPQRRNTEENAEDFTREVLVELMRNAVDNLKQSPDLAVQVLEEMNRIMVQDASTKDVFRELDGFLALVSVISAASAHSDLVKRAFIVLCEAMKNNRENKNFFETNIGYDPLQDALSSEPQILGLLLSFALNDFNYAGVFVSHDIPEGDTTTTPFIYYPNAIIILWNLFPFDDTRLRITLFSVLERLANINHRNRVLLSSFTIDILSHYITDTNVDERRILSRPLKRLLEMGAAPHISRTILQNAVNEDESLNLDVLDIIRSAVKARWPKHLSLEHDAEVDWRGGKRLPVEGFTLTMWLRIENFGDSPLTLFAMKTLTQTLFSATLLPNGKIIIASESTQELPKAKISKNHWTHLAIVHYPHKSTKPTIRIFLDGSLTDSMHWSYPKSHASIEYRMGGGDASWTIGPTHVLSTALEDTQLRLIAHLSSRYSGRFQDENLIRFLSRDAKTSLTMFLASGTAKIKESGWLKESQILFSMDHLHHNGDVVSVDAQPFDLALWKLGGAAVALRLVQLSNTPHELSRTIGILTDGIRSSWQNSSDMERLKGYQILADILRIKAKLINITAYETLFEAFGIKERIPENSTIAHPTAYRVLALDFSLWAQAPSSIQRVHFEHFAVLLSTSRYAEYNKKRISKMNLVSKILFVLQMRLYTDPEGEEGLLGVLRVAITQLLPMGGNVGRDQVAKPIVSYLAANLHAPEGGGSSSPASLSVTSLPLTLDALVPNRQKTAERVFEVLVSVLSSHPTLFSYFSIYLPTTRIALLLLGGSPSPSTASLVLRLMKCGVRANDGFGRKFELISGWGVLRSIFPGCWNEEVEGAAFVLLDPGDKGKLGCSQMFPVILCALQKVLTKVEESDGIVAAERLIERIIDVYSNSAAIRQLFQSQQTTQLFISAFKDFVGKVATGAVGRVLLEKLNHLASLISMNEVVAGFQKQDIATILQQAERLAHPNNGEVHIDPDLIQDTRSVRQKITSARFSGIVQVGERAIIKTMTRISEWRQVVQDAEKKKFRRNLLDAREERRQIERLNEWSIPLHSEQGLWPMSQGEFMWRLDETEGPNRIRKKLEPVANTSISSAADSLQASQIMEPELPSAHTALSTRPEVPPWVDQDAHDSSLTEFETQQLAEEVADDKLRRVRHELEPGDVVQSVATVARVDGVDSSPGLLMFGKTHLYMLDGVVEDSSGDIIDASQAPKSLFFVPGSVVELDGPQRAQRWTLDQLSTFSEKTFLFRDVALELFFKDSRSLLVVFGNRQLRGTFISKLSARLSDAPLLAIPDILPLFTRAATKAPSTRAEELASATRKWQAREISNFSYISVLNQISGRTPSDATQYPVFPWVLRDYSSRKLDLNSSDTFRDLSKPMGALTPARVEAAQLRYESLEGIGEKPFHYGTHFSSSMTVCHFLIRVAPFTSMFKTLQGGDWDLPDRLFSDMGRAYESAGSDMRGDVRELIPEMFEFPEFLENYQNLDFGVQTVTGHKIHDVRLPPWAMQDPLLFVVAHRQALESDYVSEHLPEWIDLIWGSKQRDVKSLNVFHPLSYEGSIDLDKITDDLEREATVGIIHNFGQTPRKLFNEPHPQRYMHGFSTLPLGTLHGIVEDFQLLTQAKKPTKDLGQGVVVGSLSLDTGERVIPSPVATIPCAITPSEAVAWSEPGDLSLKVDNKIVQVIEAAYCTCAVFADTQHLVTGSSDFTVRVWRIVRPSTGSRLIQSHVMRMHTDVVHVVCASRAWSAIVSGSEDGTAAIWDLNRGLYVRSISHGSPVNLAVINESTGYIATCSFTKLCLHTINARPITVLDLTLLDYQITSLAFHEREYSHRGILATGTSDGKIDLRTWSADNTPDGERAKWEFETLRTLEAEGRPVITALRFVGETLCHGEDSGKSYFWTLPES